MCFQCVILYGEITGIADPFSCICFIGVFKGDNNDITSRYFCKYVKLKAMSASVLNVTFCCQCSREKGIFYRAGKEINGEALEAAGHTAPKYIIKLPQERPFSLHSLLPKRDIGCVVAALLGEESVARVVSSLLGLPKNKHDIHTV